MVTVQVRSIAMLQRRLRPCQVERRSYAACRGKDLSCGTTRSTGCTYKSSGKLPFGDQSVAAIIDESLQVMVRKGTPPKGGQLSTLWHSKVPNSKQSGVSSRSMKCCTIAKGDLDNPSMVSVPLCTKLEMSDINKGN